MFIISITVSLNASYILILNQSKLAPRIITRQANIKVEEKENSFIEKTMTINRRDSAENFQFQISPNLGKDNNLKVRHERII